MIDKDFTTREISKSSDDGVFTVTRKRDSNGVASIHILMHGISKGSIHLDNHKNDFGDNYEQAAFELANLIDAVASDPCLLD